MYTAINFLAYGLMIVIGTLLAYLLIKEPEGNAKDTNSPKEEYKWWKWEKTTRSVKARILSIVFFLILTVIYRLLLQPSMKEFYSGDKQHNILGMEYLQKGDNQKALNEFNIAISKNPNNYNAYNNRGLVFQRIDKWDSARVNYKKAIQLNDTFNTAYENLGGLDMITYEWDEAITIISTGIKLNPEGYVNYANRGYIYENQKKYALAKQDYDMSVKILETPGTVPYGPGSSGQLALLYYHRACVYYSLGDKKKALKDVNKALELGFPKDQATLLPYLK